MFNPKINILILNWNGHYVLNDCIQSIIKSKYNNYSITIIDNGSNDNSANKYNGYDNIKIISINNNLGFARGYNYAFKKLVDKKDDYYLLLNNDTILDSYTIANLIKSISKYGNDNIYSPRILNYENGSNWFCGGGICFLTGFPYHYGIDTYDSYITYKTKKTTFVSGCCMLISKKNINKLNGFNEKFTMYFEDVDLCIRAKKENSQCYFISNSVIYHRISHSIGGRFSFKKYFLKLDSLLKFLYYNHNLFIFIYYFFINLLFVPIYVLKFFLKFRRYA